MHIWIASSNSIRDPTEYAVTITGKTNMTNPLIQRNSSYIWSQAVIKWINNDLDKRYWPNKFRQSVPSGKVIPSCWVEIRSLQKTETLNALIWNIASHYIPSITQNMTEKVTYAVINSIDYLPLIHTQFTPFSLVEHKRRPSQKIAENWLICNNLRILHCYKSCDPSCWKEAC